MQPVLKMDGRRVVQGLLEATVRRMQADREISREPSVQRRRGAETTTLQGITLGPE